MYQKAADPNPKQGTLKDLCDTDRAKVSELMKLYAAEKSQRQELEHRANKDIKALKREVKLLKQVASRKVKAPSRASSGKEVLGTPQSLRTPSRSRRPLLDSSDFTASQLRTERPRNKTVERGCSPATEAESFSSVTNFVKHSQYESPPEATQFKMKEVSTSPIKERRHSAHLSRSVLTQTVQDAGTQTRIHEPERSRPNALQEAAPCKVSSSITRSSGETFGCRTDRKIEASKTDKSQDTTRDQTTLNQSTTEDLDVSQRYALDEVKHLREDILSLSMNLRQLRSSRSASASSRRGKEDNAEKKPKQVAPTDLGQLHQEHLKLILDKVHCGNSEGLNSSTLQKLLASKPTSLAADIRRTYKHCCLHQDAIGTSERNPLRTPSTHGKSKRHPFNTSRGRNAYASLFNTRELDEAELSNRSPNYSSRLRSDKAFGMYDANLFSLVAELEQQPAPRSTFLSILVEDEELDRSDISCFNSAAKGIPL